MSLTELLSTYFPQVALLLGGFGALMFYFIKRYFDLKSKKIEIRHTVFQNNKLDAIKSYFFAYTIMERAISSISTVRIVTNKYTTQELDEIMKTPIDNLLSSNLNLTLFLDNNLLVQFDKITDQILWVNGLYSDAFFEDNKDDGLTQISNRLFGELEKVKRKNKADFRRNN